MEQPKGSDAPVRRTTRVAKDKTVLLDDKGQSDKKNEVAEDQKMVTTRRTHGQKSAASKKEPQLIKDENVTQDAPKPTRGRSAESQKKGKDAKFLEKTSKGNKMKPAKKALEESHLENKKKAPTKTKKESEPAVRRSTRQKARVQ